MEGTFKGWVVNDSYGFIAPDDDKKGDVFLHVSKLEPGVHLKKGEKVKFDVEINRKGRAAINVKKLLRRVLLSRETYW